MVSTIGINGPGDGVGGQGLVYIARVRGERLNRSRKCCRGLGWAETF